MKKKKIFDCVQMKWDIQKSIDKEYSDVSDAQKYKIIYEQLRIHPIFSKYLKKSKIARS